MRLRVFLWPLGGCGSGYESTIAQTTVVATRRRVRHDYTLTNPTVQNVPDRLTVQNASGRVVGRWRFYRRSVRAPGRWTINVCVRPVHSFGFANSMFAFLIMNVVLVWEAIPCMGGYFPPRGLLAQ